MNKSDFLTLRINDDRAQFGNLCEALHTKTNEVLSMLENDQEGNNKFIPMCEIRPSIRECSKLYADIIDFYASYCNDKYLFDVRDSSEIQSEIADAISSVLDAVIFLGDNFVVDGKLNSEDTLRVMYRNLTNTKNRKKIFLVVRLSYGINGVTLLPFEVSTFQTQTGTSFEVSINRSDLMSAIEQVPGCNYSVLSVHLCEEVSASQDHDLEYIHVTDIDRYAYVYGKIIQTIDLSDESQSCLSWSADDDVLISSTLVSKEVKTKISSIDTASGKLTLASETPFEKRGDGDIRNGEPCSIQRITGTSRYFHTLCSFSRSCAVYPTFAVLDFTTDANNNAVENNTDVQLTAHGTGGSGSYLYAFSVYAPSSDKWYKIQTANKSNTTTWSASVVGEKTLYVYIRDTETDEVVQKTLPFTIVTPMTIDNFGIDCEDKIEQHATITLTMSAVGGSGNYKYRFVVENDIGGQMTIRDYTTSNTATWTADWTGVKTLYFCAKDLKTGIIRRETKTIAVVNGALAVKSFSASTGTSAPNGTSVTLTATGSGGTEKYQYRFVRLTGTDTWTIIQDYSSKNTAVWTAGPAGECTLYFCVKDSSGTIEKTSMSFTVT